MPRISWQPWPHIVSCPRNPRLISKSSKEKGELLRPNSGKKAYFTNHRGRQVTKFVYICAEENSTRGKGGGRWAKSRRLLSQNSAVFRHSGGVFARGRLPHVGVPSGARPLARHALADSATPLQIPRPKTAKRTFGGGGTRLIYIATRRSRKASFHSPDAPAPLWMQGNRAPNTIGTPFHAVCCMVSPCRHTASRSQRHRSAQAVRSVGTDRPPPHTARPLAHAPSSPSPPPRPPKHGSHGRCPPLPSDSRV